MRPLLPMPTTDGPVAPRPWRALGRLWSILAGATLAVLAVAGGRAAAQDIPSFTVEVGIHGFSDPDADRMVTVTVTSTGALQGRVEVRSNTGAVASRPIEMAGGTTKAVRILTDATSNAGAVDVSLFDGDRLVSTRVVNVQTTQDVEVVGISPGLAERVGKLPDSVELPSSLGRAVFATWDTELFDLGPGALRQFDTLVSASAELSALSPAQRTTLLVWLNDGGVLVLDDTTDLSALPAAWRPGPASYMLAGRGLVRVLPGATSAGRWAQLVVPTGARSRESLFLNDFGVTGNADAALVRSAGISLPRLGSVILPLIAYALLAAFGVYVLVRTLRRMTLAWVLIPGLAVVTSLLLVAVGTGWRDSGRPATMSFLDCSVPGCSVNASLLNFSRSGGTLATELPAGWTMTGGLMSFVGRRNDSTTLQRRADGTAALTNRLDPGQIVVNNLVGMAQVPGLSVDATSDGTTVTGTVTNNSPSAVREVAVIAAGSFTRLGTLEPGASRPYSLTAQVRAPNQAIWDIWQGDNPDAQPILTQWGAAAMTTSLTASGLVRVAGWVDDLAPLIAPGAASAGALSSTARIMPRGGIVPDSVRTSVVRSTQNPGATGLEDLVVRFMLPPESTPLPPLTMTLPAGIRSVDVLGPSGWQTLRTDGDTVTLPREAVVQGVVLARILNRDLAVLADPSAMAQLTLAGPKAGG